MNNPREHRSWILGLCERVATCALALTMVLLTILATGRAQAQTVLVGAPNPGGSYYGMCCNDETSVAAEFTLAGSEYVTTVNVVLLGSSIYDFSLQDSLTGSITTFARAVITAPNAGMNTEAMTVNATLPAGTYYLVSTEDPASTLRVPGWWVSDGTLITNAGSVANGVWARSGGPSGTWNFTSGNGYNAPTFAVYGSAAGPFAYVANMSSNTVSKISIPNSSVVNTIPVGSGPWGAAVSPDQTQVYVSSKSGNSVSVINTASNSVAATIPVGSSPLGVAFTPDGTAAYVVNGASKSVSVINTASQTVAHTVSVQSSPVGVAMALTSNGTFAYVTNSASNTVSVIAAGSSPNVVKTIPVGSGPHGVAVTPNSSLAYVVDMNSNSVSVISVASNTVTATIPVGTSPSGVTFTPDSSFAYVTNYGSNTVSVIDTASNTVVATVPGFNGPTQVALTMDGASAYVTNQNANDVSVIATASNTITGTVEVGSSPVGVAIASAPPTELQITLPLSPTQPNVFNFGPHNQVVQYPPNTSFSGINMTTTAVQITQTQFQQRVAGTQFANATCIVYAETGGNCVDYQVTCTDNSGNQIACPSESEPTISVQTSFSTSQAIVNPGYLTTPIGQNAWTNIFTGYSDPTVKGKTTGFSEFVAVSLGATNPQGLAQFKLLHPLLPKTLVHGTNLPVVIQLKSVANGKSTTDASVNISVVMIADDDGNPAQQLVLSAMNAFKQPRSGDYTYLIKAGRYTEGTYIVTIYGNAFPAYQGKFMVVEYASSTTLVSNVNPSSYGQSVTLTAEVTSSAGAPPDGEVVSFMQGKKVLATGTLSGGSASFTTSAFKAGATSITAVYGGDLEFKGSTSKPLKQVVDKASTTTILTSSANPSQVGQPITFTASVTPHFAGTPAGTVVFKDGTKMLKTVTLSEGVAKYTTSTLNSGTHTITVTYAGNTSFTGSSASLTQTVVGDGR